MATGISISKNSEAVKKSCEDIVDNGGIPNFVKIKNNRRPLVFEQEKSQGGV